jgi:hypothetical protein
MDNDSELKPSDFYFKYDAAKRRQFFSSLTDERVYMKNIPKSIIDEIEEVKLKPEEEKKIKKRRKSKLEVIRLQELEELEDWKMSFDEHFIRRKIELNFAQKKLLMSQLNSVQGQVQYENMIVLHYDEK